MKYAFIFMWMCLGNPCLAWTHGNPTYNGVASTRGGILDQLDATNTQMMSRTGTFARDNLTNVQVALSNFYIPINPTGVETPPGAATTVTASIEYPAGVCTQILFSASASGTIPNGGVLFSDVLTISVPKNAKYWVRQYRTNSSGSVYADGAAALDTANMGDAVTAGASGVVDKTVNCTSVTASYTNGSPLPMAIISVTTVPTVCILGDSIAYYLSVNGNTNGDGGIVAPSIGPTFGYANLAVSGDAAFAFLTNNTQRRKIMPFCSHFIVEYGRNDFFLGQTLAQLKTSLTSIYALTGGRTFQTTQIPDTTSSDNWTTTGNQTPAAWNADRVTLNDQFRAATFGPALGEFDATAQVESALDSGKWRVDSPCGPGPGNWTFDGIHPNGCAMGFVSTSGYIDAARIHLP